MQPATNNQRLLTNAPALGLVSFLVCGIIADRALETEQIPVGLAYLMGLQLILFLIWGILQRFRNRWAPVLIFLLVASTGAMWHHLFWQTASDQQIIRYVRHEAEPFDLCLRVVSPPERLTSTLPRFASAWPAESRMRFLGEVQAVNFENAWQPVQGRIQVTVACSELACRPGESLRVLGTLKTIPPPENPAGYDAASQLRSRQIVATMFCDSAEALIPLPTEGHSSAKGDRQYLEAFRNRIRNVYEQFLSPQSAGLAEALILGDRQHLEPEIEQAFQHSGLMHLLSISGLHVALIGMLFFCGGRWLNLSQRQLAVLMLSGMTVCLLLAELRPPVLRAWTIGVILVLSWQLKRPIAFLQSLSLSAGIVLLINPSWLFDTGTQLSFLAMLGIYAVTVSARLWSANTEEIEPEDSVLTLGQRSWRWISHSCRDSLALSTGITLVVLPLLAYHFQRITWAGIPATLLSIPLLSAALALLLVLGIAGMFSSWLALLIAWPAEWILRGQAWVADLFADFPLLGWNTIRPALLSLLVLYGLGILIVCIVVRNNKKGSAVWGWLSWVVLLVLVFEGPGWVHRIFPPPLECRALSIGHGNASLLRCPNGKCVLLDAGSMENGRIAASIIQSNLAEMHEDRLEAIIVSHTDTDHLNAIPFLLDQIPVREILLNPVGLNPRHPGMQALAEAAFRKGIRLRWLQPGDRIVLDEQIQLHVLQCPKHPGEWSGNDNADSLVIELQARGHRILFPGDVSDVGQQKLISRVSSPYKLILAPHHGGRRENTTAFAYWADPGCVFVSAGNLENADHLREIYGGRCPLLFTAEGALRFQIASSGLFSIDQWDRRQFWQRVDSENTSNEL